MTSDAPLLPGAPNQPEWLALVREKVESLRYGVVQIVVHDRKVTQIERTEKTRIERSGRADEASHGSHI